MRRFVVGFGLAAIASMAMAQSSPVAAPPAGEPVAHNLNSPDSTTVLTVAPDPSATPMADPQSAAQFGSPSAVDSPSSPMPNPTAFPPVKRSAKRPPWVQKAPAGPQPAKPAPPS